MVSVLQNASFAFLDSQDLQPLGGEVRDTAWPKMAQRRIAMEVPHLPIGWVVVVELLCEEWREGMLNTRGSSAVMREAEGREMHAQQHVRALGHRLVRDKTGTLERVLFMFTQPNVAAATNITPRDHPLEATCVAIIRGHCQKQSGSIQRHAERAATGVRHAGGCLITAREEWRTTDVHRQHGMHRGLLRCVRVARCNVVSWKSPRLWRRNNSSATRDGTPFATDHRRPRRRLRCRSLLSAANAPHNWRAPANGSLRI